MNKFIIFFLVLVIFAAVLFFATKKNEKQKMSNTIESEKIDFQESNYETHEIMLADSEAIAINVQNSLLTWNAKKIIGNANHEGTVGIREGKLRTDKGEIVGGDFVVDMTSLGVSDGTGGKLEEHLKSDDFFDVKRYPEARLSIINIEMSGDGYNVVADLTIKGITNEITFPATFSKNGRMISADANFSIDRTRWNIKYGSGLFFENLGDQAIDDMINFNIHVET